MNLDNTAGLEDSLVSPDALFVLIHTNFLHASFFFF